MCDVRDAAHTLNRIWFIPFHPFHYENHLLSNVHVEIWNKIQFNERNIKQSIDSEFNSISYVEIESSTWTLFLNMACLSVSVSVPSAQWKDDTF